MSEGKNVENESEESKFRQALEERGKLKPVTHPKPKPAGEFTPIEVEGAPLSELIIEDRK